MNALEAAARPGILGQVAELARCQPVLVARVLRGWTGGHQGKREAILREAAGLGVDVATIPQLTPEQVEAMRQAPSAEVRRLRARVAELEGEAEVADLWRAASGKIVEALLREPCVVAMPYHVIDLVEQHVRRYTKLRAFAVGLVQQLRDANEETNRFQRDAETAGGRTIAAIDAQDAVARERVAALPTPAPIPIRREPKPRPHVVRLEGFPPDAVTRG